MIKHKFKVKTLPWLLLAENTEDNNLGLRKVFNPYNNKFYQLKMPETFGCRCWGSAHGWLVTYNQHLDLHMFNPLTKARMSLPPISCFPYQWMGYFPRPCEGAHESMRSEFIYKTFVIEVAEDDFIVFVSYFFEWKKLAFARPGDRSWTSIDQPGPTVVGYLERLSDVGNCVNDVIHRGTQIIILYEDTSLGFLDISDLSDPQKLVVKDYLPIPPIILVDQRNLGIKVRDYVPPLPGIHEEFDTSEYGSYLANSCGNIFMVIRDRCYIKEDRDPDGNVYATFQFMVYKLDFGSRKWTQDNRLGNVTLFVGNCSSMSVLTPGASKCKPNCIYYVDDYFKGWDKPITLGGDDMGVCALENGDLDPIEQRCYTYSKFQTPLWFMPQL